MKKKTFWIIVGIVAILLLILLVWQTMKISSIASAGGIAKTGASAVQAASSSGMVGGC